MLRAQLIDTIADKILKDLGFYEITAYAAHAEQMLVWERSPDNLWIAEGEEEAYHVEANLSEPSI
ncbi:hypothetical protein FNU79_11255 [Deinococcus detaillensis]|uniref:Uncharacterized protein n=1 Tax=Deinococcus detaillensis TaxID=2592048 RepID=A0A553UWE0_9DEIO|nr:hypothetical protein [Deinococcus detaillensis]TSA84528.1 hypothetical protein FNU79_11255 [Deinococcus detaillensis]